MKKCTVSELGDMKFGKHDKPCRFYADGQDISGRRVDKWTHLSCTFVQWLIDNHFISLEKLPVPDHRGHGKFFINIRDQHENQTKGGFWKKVGPYYIDTKYNADDHIKNILSTLRYLGATSPQFQISFRPD